MILGIDAANIRAGGGVSSLTGLLRAADPSEYGFSQVILWGGQATLSMIEDRPWLVKSHQPALDQSLPYRAIWQRFQLSKLARFAGCDVLFIPGGSFAGDYRPIVTMSQNLLPFEWRELRRYSWGSSTFIKLLVLRIIQGRTFRRADGLMFISHYARMVVMRVVKSVAGQTRIVPNAMDGQFSHRPREQLGIDRYSGDRPFRILYVSIIDMYKHQWRVVKAVEQLRASGLPVTLDLIGPAYPPALKILRRTLQQVDLDGEFVRYHGQVPYSELVSSYIKADLFLFASSCENMPIILLEAMAAGLPIVCSNRGPMPEVLGDTGVQFDPEDHEDIARAIRTMVLSPELRTEKSNASFERAQSYSWTRSARDTFSFLSEVARAARVKQQVSPK